MVEDMEQVDGIWYEYDGDTATVGLHTDDDIKDKFVKIPAEVKDSDGYAHRVTKIDSGAFADCNIIEAIEISDSVEEIGSNAFSGCVNLRLIKLPNKLSEIPEGAFFGCNNLKTTVIPDSVKLIGDKAFWGCENLTDIILPESLEKLGEDVFGYCEKLTSLFIPASVNEIHSSSLSMGSSFENLEVDRANVRYFSEGNCVMERTTNKLIAGCKTSVMPDCVTEIGDCAFAMISGLKQVKIPNSAVKIGRKAFSKCYSLEEVYIPSSVTQIGENAFEECNFGRVKLICYFAKKPDGWADNIGVDKKNFVWIGKKGIFGKLKNLLKNLFRFR